MMGQAHGISMIPRWTFEPVIMIIIDLHKIWTFYRHSEVWFTKCYYLEILIVFVMFGWSWVKMTTSSQSTWLVVTLPFELVDFWHFTERCFAWNLPTTFWIFSRDLEYLLFIWNLSSITWRYVFGYSIMDCSVFMSPILNELSEII